MTNIVVPELGESVVEARVARWLKKEGDRVEIGEPVVELETEKVDLEVNAERGGVITSIKHKEGDDVKIGELLAVVDESAPAPVAKASGNGRSSKTPAAPPPPPTPNPPPTATPPPLPHPVQQPPPLFPAPSAPPAAAKTARTGDRLEERQRMSKRRATIARRLVEAQHNAAMLTTFNDIDMSAMMELRERHKEAFKQQHGVGLGIASFFVNASIAALRAFPMLNAQIEGAE